MEDSQLHLNSIHLCLPRREDFRRAREALLSSRGSATVRLEADQVRHGFGPPDTCYEFLNKDQPLVDSPASFVLLEGKRAYPLKIGVNTVGRLPDNDVVVDDPHVSRRHCAVLVHSSQCCEVHDVASKNGTYVNGQRIAGATRLKAGDEIRMCDLRLVLMGSDGAAALPNTSETSPL